MGISRGLGVYVIRKHANQFFNFIPGNTSGLLGYWDDSMVSEFRRPDGSFLKTNSNLKEIHRNFGQLCKNFLFFCNDWSQNLITDAKIISRHLCQLNRQHFIDTLQAKKNAPF